MRVWRICRKRYATTALAGRGGLVADGRWHTRGRPIVYASGSLALAALEVLVHVERSALPADLVQVEIDVPDRLAMEHVEPGELPRNWRAYPAPVELARRGDAWLAAGRTAVLRVPSAVIAEECNYLLNPLHRDLRRIAIIRMERFTFDRRLRP